MQWMSRYVTRFVLVLAAAVATGCETFQPDRVIRHPDAPMLVTEVRGEWLRVSAYDMTDGMTDGALIDTGWINTKDIEGWTIAKFDWATFLGTDDFLDDGGTE